MQVLLKESEGGMNSHPARIVERYDFEACPSDFVASYLVKKSSAIYPLQWKKS
jgi:hypothetical protein